MAATNATITRAKLLNDVAPEPAALSTFGFKHSNFTETPASDSSLPQAESIIQTYNLRDRSSFLVSGVPGESIVI